MEGGNSALSIMNLISIILLIVVSLISIQKFKILNNMKLIINNNYKI